jgi:hypothetical protein
MNKDQIKLIELQRRIKSLNKIVPSNRMEGWGIRLQVWGMGIQIKGILYRMARNTNTKHANACSLNKTNSDTNSNKN